MRPHRIGWMLCSSGFMKLEVQLFRFVYIWAVLCSFRIYCGCSSCPKSPHTASCSRRLSSNKVATLVSGWVSCTLVVMPTTVTKLCVLYDVCSLGEKQFLKLRMNVFAVRYRVKLKQLSIKNVIQNSTTVWDFRFFQQCWWGFICFGIWCSVGWVVPVVSKEGQVVTLAD